jgi:hypothetical protein
VDARDRRFDDRKVTGLLEELHALRVVPVAEDA